MKLPKVRVLPVLAVTVAGAILMRGESAVDGFGPAVGAVKTALAQTAPQDPAGQDGDGEQDTSDSRLPADAECLAGDDREILLSLRERRNEIQSARDRLEEERAEIATVRERLKEERENLEELKADVEDRLAKREQKAREDLQRQVEIFTNMRPEKAAGVISEMRLRLAGDIIESMPPRSSAPILDSMDSGSAFRITSELDRRRRMLKGEQPMTGKSPAMQEGN